MLILQISASNIHIKKIREQLKITREILENFIYDIWQKPWIGQWSINLQVWIQNLYRSVGLDSLSKMTTMVRVAASRKKMSSVKLNSVSDFVCVTEQHCVSRFFTRLWSVRKPFSISLCKNFMGCYRLTYIGKKI